MCLRKHILLYFKIFSFFVYVLLYALSSIIFLLKSTVLVANYSTGSRVGRCQDKSRKLFRTEFKISGYISLHCVHPFLKSSSMLARTVLLQLCHKQKPECWPRRKLQTNCQHKKVSRSLPFDGPHACFLPLILYLGARSEFRNTALIVSTHSQLNASGRYLFLRLSYFSWLKAYRKIRRGGLAVYAV